MRQAEALHAPYVAAIGVHCGKFTREHDAGRVADAMRREGIEHPVLNDPDFTVWKAYAVRAWPTLIFLDPEGMVFARHEGEISPEELARILKPELQRAASQGILSDAPIPSAKLAAVGGILRYPGGLAFGEGNALFVADSGHHRVLRLHTGTSSFEAIGSGSEGFLDGSAEQAQFNDPHGLFANTRHVFVADSGNHAIRRIGLPQGGVTTIAGSGRLAQHLLPPGPPRSTDLRSPWDVHLQGEQLFIAMAGAHQIWRLDLRRQSLSMYAGSGYEALYDASLARSRFAQPMGLAAQGDTLYAADAESSAIREVPMSGEGVVRTLIGQGLFDFGDRDGPLDLALLQHPSGLAVDGDRLYIADTYNDKIRVLLLREGRIETFLDGLREPHAIKVQDGALFIADSGNHRILRAPLAGGEPETLFA
ncbi:MAG: alkyl hydroperoxide reductase [Thermaerobacter sp.]|nr:alkyl hydroperoxide reductase [Thermaerobacter sp.]